MAKPKAKSDEPKTNSPAQDMPPRETFSVKVEDDTAIKSPHGHLTIKGQQVGPDQGAKETRLFQTDPSMKEWLTKDEAKKKGFFWKG